MVRNPVEEGIEQDRAARRAQKVGGPVAQIARKYDASSTEGPGRRLLGFLLSLTYDELSIVTCDPWKRACGGGIEGARLSEDIVESKAIRGVLSTPQLRGAQRSLRSAKVCGDLGRASMLSTGL